MASLRTHDSDLWTEDVFEVFLAPRELEEYYEIEVNPLGTIFDARVQSPQRQRTTMSVDRSWTCADLWRAIRIRRIDGRVTGMTAILGIPFASLGSPPVEPRGEWRANFYRIDRSGTRVSYSAWSAPLAEPADFHRPDSFGSLVFEQE